VETKRGRGRPPKANKMVHMTIRVDPEVAEFYRKNGRTDLMRKALKYYMDTVDTPE
jgi:uncharacterized protein (DUF4415 family)